jgi:hypothetical protein
MHNYMYRGLRTISHYVFFMSLKYGFFFDGRIYNEYKYLKTKH